MEMVIVILSVGVKEEKKKKKAAKAVGLHAKSQNPLGRRNEPRYLLHRPVWPKHFSRLEMIS